MKKIIVLLCLFYSVVQNLFCQEWIKYYGQGQNGQCINIINDYDKGFVIGGMVNNYKYLWIVKTDINGNILWNKRLGDGIHDGGLGNIEKTNDNGYILCASWTKNNPSWDAFIIKLNPCGETEWCKALDTPDNYDMGLKVKQTPEGDYLLMGGYFRTNPESNTSLFKFNAGGDLLWHRFYPMDSVFYQDEPTDLLADDDGYLFVTSRYYPDPGSSSPAVIRHHFTKTDTSGNQLWDLVYGVNEYYYGGPWCLKKSLSGDYYEGGNHLTSNGTAVPGFVKIRPDGTRLYDADLMTGTYWGGISSIDFLQDSLLIMVGAWYTNSNTGYHVFFKSDTLGNLRKTKVLPKAEAGYWSACKTDDDKFIAVGNDYINNSWRVVTVKVNSDLEYDSLYTQPFTYDSLCPHPITSDTIDPNCDNVLVSVDEPFKKPETTQLKVYPNPTDKNVTIELPKYLVVTDNSGNVPATTIYHQWSSATLQAIDLQGKTVLQHEVANTGVPLQLDVSLLPAGMYQFRLVYRGKPVAGSKVVVK